MNNKEVMLALLQGYKLCNINWFGVKYIHLVGNDLLDDKGNPFELRLAYRYSGLTKVYINTWNV